MGRALAQFLMVMAWVWASGGTAFAQEADFDLDEILGGFEDVPRPVPSEEADSAEPAPDWLSSHPGPVH